MSFGFFVAGCLFLIAGVVYLAHLMQVPQAYAMGSLAVVIGVATVSRAQSARGSRV
jgi:uncharacterized membrane protein HdeD (DUF308 family)